MASAGDVSASPGELACESMVTLPNALTRLEVGELGILSFGCDETKVVHDLGLLFLLMRVQVFLKH